MDTCDCGMCGVCREQWEYEQRINKPGWHTPPASEEEL